METVDQLADPTPARRVGQPGLVLVWHARRPCLAALRLPLDIGRGAIPALSGDDAFLSRNHARVEWAGDAFRITDLDSRNGTFIDGKRVTGELATAEPILLRTGDALFLFVRDVEQFVDGAVHVSAGRVMGPTLAATWDRIAHLAGTGNILHLTGESGSGKELAARHFHESGRFATGPFVPVNCATVPENLAERLLFGARKGAYSGADRDVEGYLQAAHKGTLFLDEVGELPLVVQAKLLRAIESHEVTALGATRAVKVEFDLVSATHEDLRERVAARSFREDLYFRIARPTLRVPPLRERREDIPYLVDLLLASRGVTVRTSLVEAALLRRWPGNVRELAAELGAALASAQAAGRTEVAAVDLADAAGAAVRAAAASEPVAEAPTVPEPQFWRGMPVEQIRAALEAERWNVSAAARRLKIHRTQLMRIIERFSLTPR